MKPYWTNGRATLWQGHVLDCLAAMEAGSVHCGITSPPYWGLRSYPGSPVEWPAVSYAPLPGLPPVEVPAWSGCLGLEPTPEAFVGHIVLVARALWRVLRDDGTFWLNFGDSYASSGKAETMTGNASTLDSGYGLSRNPKATNNLTGRASTPHGLKQKDLIGIPWRIAFALQADGWYLRSDIIWAKGVSFCPTYSGSCMPESVRDRPTKGHEYVFLLSKNKQYFYDGDAVREESAPSSMARSDLARTGTSQKHALTTANEQRCVNMDAGQYGNGRNLRTVWTINPGNFPGSHFATFPTKLVEPMIKAGTSAKGCCPECGASWVRVTEKANPPKSSYTDKRRPDNVSAVQGGTAGMGQKLQDWYNEHPTTTTGWTPTCSCDAGEPVPCTVCDPFLGSGTTVKVADFLGRHSVGIELSKTYCDEHIIPRLTEPLFEWAEQEQQEPEPEIEQLGLL